MITPAQTFLNQKKITYQTYSYECTVDHDFGNFAAQSLGFDPKQVFKTIILQHDKSFVTAIIPVNCMISLKNAARAMGFKALELADIQTTMRITGYVIGGVSPFGQKKKNLTLLDQSALNYEEIYVSGGRRGFSIAIAPQQLVTLLNATVADFVEHKDR